MLPCPLNNLGSIDLLWNKVIIHYLGYVGIPLE